jgi:hypothetical protein
MPRGSSLGRRASGSSAIGSRERESETLRRSRTRPVPRGRGNVHREDGHQAGPRRVVLSPNARARSAESSVRLVWGRAAWASGRNGPCRDRTCDLGIKSPSERTATSRRKRKPAAERGFANCNELPAAQRVEPSRYARGPLRAASRPPSVERASDEEAKRREDRRPDDDPCRGRGEPADKSPENDPRSPESVATHTPNTPAISSASFLRSARSKCP